MMADVKRRSKSLVVERKRFDRAFTQLFGRLPNDKEFEEWCVMWGGELKKDKCVLEL
jgi:hypothetical protein